MFWSPNRSTGRIQRTASIVLFPVNTLEGDNPRHCEGRRSPSHWRQPFGLRAIFRGREVGWTPFGPRAIRWSVSGSRLIGGGLRSRSGTESTRFDAPLLFQGYIWGRRWLTNSL